MKKLLTTLSIVLLGSCVYAVVLGVEPPLVYMNALRSCKAGTFNQVSGALNITYKIKGKLPNGRCEVEFSNYTDFTNVAAYEYFISFSKNMAKSFGGEIKESELPTQAQMIEQGKKEAQVYTCKFSDKERKDLYNAYLKHDSQNPPAEVGKDSMKFSFDSSKVSSYDKLMQSYYFNGPCMSQSTDDEDYTPSEYYACEYSDTTCYVTLYKMDGGNGSSISCSGKSNLDNARWEIVKNHAESGKCSKLF